MNGRAAKIIGKIVAASNRRGGRVSTNLRDLMKRRYYSLSAKEKRAWYRRTRHALGQLAEVAK